MSSKKPTETLDYELFDFEMPALRVEPVQINSKPVTLPQFELEAVLNQVPEESQELQTNIKAVKH